LDGIKKLVAQDRAIADLIGMHYLKNVKTVLLGNTDEKKGNDNSISSLEPLRGLFSLNALGLSGNSLGTKKGVLNPPLPLSILRASI
jgi:hypothetical protein